MDVQLITRLAQSDFLSVPPTDERFDIGMHVHYCPDHC